MRQHRYAVQIDWTGNDGDGTKTYRSYRRDHTIVCEGKPEIPGSSEPSFRGDRSRYSPEELLVASVSSCHMLWYLHLCASSNITVLEYHDAASGAMEETDDGSGQFVGVTLRPIVKISPGDDPTTAMNLHDRAHHLCFIARSVNFPVDVAPVIV